MCECATAVPSSFGLDTDGPCCLNPFRRCHRERVQSGLLSKPVEFDGFKIRMLVCTLPDDLMRDLKRGANGLQAQYNTTDAALILYMEAQRYERAQGARRTR